MNAQNPKASAPPVELLSLNLDDLDVEELESRLELAAAMPTCLRSGGCGCNGQCGRNT